MTIKELCEKINLQEVLVKEVSAFSQEFDFEQVRPLLNDLKKVEKSKNALAELGKILAPDEHNAKILACSLKCAVETYDIYQETGISEEIFVETMKCFTRFCQECYEITGTYAFDREWWTPRQLGMMIFRIGELEYEREMEDGKPVVHVHIPSDACILPEKCDESLEKAAEFFKTFYPEYVDVPYLCDSWMMVPALKELLKPASNILKFQKRFEILSVNPEDKEFPQWIFKTRDYCPEKFPENTSLQRDMKNYILSGGKIGCAWGRMR